MQLLQRQMALVPPAYSAVSSPPQVVAQHTHVCMHGCQEIKSVVPAAGHPVKGSEHIHLKTAVDVTAEDLFFVFFNLGLSVVRQIYLQTFFFFPCGQSAYQFIHSFTYSFLIRSTSISVMYIGRVDG